MEEDAGDGHNWNPNFVAVVGFVNKYNAREEIIRTQAFLERVYKGESLDSLVEEMTQQHIDPFALYYNQCVPFREVYEGRYVHGDIPADAKLIVTQGLHYILRDASDDRNASTTFIGGLMGALGVFLGVCSGEPLAALSGPVIAAGTYGLFRLGQHFTKSGKSRAFAEYLERTYNLTSSVTTDTVNDSGRVYHDLTRTVSRQDYLAGGDVKFYPSWYYDGKQTEQYSLTEEIPNGVKQAYGLAIFVENGFLPSLGVGSFFSDRTFVNGTTVELAKIKREIPVLFSIPLLIPRQDYEEFQTHIQRYVTLIVAQ